jgi:hypothetical protein
MKLCRPPFAAPLFSLLAMGLFWMGTGISYGAASNEVSYCTEARIISFQVQVTEGRLANKLQDFCKVPNSKVPPAVQKAITEIQGLHQKIAAYFGVSEEALLPTGIKVSLAASPMGSLESVETPPEIHLGVFPDWNGDPIDEPSYVHEFGHFLVHSEKGPLSSVAKKVAKYGVFSEQFPDTLALAITGSAQGTVGLPSCFAGATRQFGKIGTYDGDFEFFTPAHVFRSWESCCEEERPNQAKWDSHLKGTCKEIDQAFRDLDPKPAPRALRPADCATFPWSVDGCSVHQVSVPLNSFLLDLASHLNPSSNPPNLKFYFDALAQIKDAAPDSVFHAIRANLDSANQSVFDLLWKQYGLDVGMAIGQQEANEL